MVEPALTPGGVKGGGGAAVRGWKTGGVGVAPNGGLDGVSGGTFEADAGKAGALDCSSSAKVNLGFELCEAGAETRSA